MELAEKVMLFTSTPLALMTLSGFAASNGLLIKFENYYISVLDEVFFALYSYQAGFFGLVP